MGHLGIYASGFLAPPPHRTDVPARPLWLWLWGVVFPAAPCGCGASCVSHSAFICVPRLPLWLWLWRVGVYRRAIIIVLGVVMFSPRPPCGMVGWQTASRTGMVLVSMT